jgi:hypothetical protein
MAVGWVMHPRGSGKGVFFVLLLLLLLHPCSTLPAHLAACHRPTC